MKLLKLQTSAARMIEMGFFSLTYPFMPKNRWRSSVLYSEKTEKKLIELEGIEKSGSFFTSSLCPV